MKSATQHGYIPLPYVSGGHAEIGPYRSPSCLGLSVAMFRHFACAKLFYHYNGFSQNKKLYSKRYTYRLAPQPVAVCGGLAILLTRDGAVR